MSSAPSWLKDLAGAWVFYSVLPNWPWPQPTFKRIARFAPWIGLIIGSLQSCIWIFLSQMNWPRTSLILLTIAFGAWLTGGLHLDGLMDTADGLAAGKERCLEAMKDSRVGASGVICLLIIIFVQIAALTKLDQLAPFAFPIVAFWGRCSPLWAMNNFNYLRDEDPNFFHKKNFKNFWDVIPALIGILFCLIYLGFLSPQWVPKLLISCGLFIGLIPSIAIPEILGNRLGGHSGDSYGATVVLVESLMFLLLACFW